MHVKLLQVSVTVASDYTYSVIVHNRNLSASHELIRKQGKTIKTAQAFKQLLERLVQPSPYTGRLLVLNLACTAIEYLSMGLYCQNFFMKQY